MAAADRYADEVCDESCTGAQVAETINDFCAGWRAADQHPHWIPVKEERPKASGDYIICEKRGFVREAHYFELDDLWMLHGGALVSPTHWMPLPEAPRKEENNEKDNVQ